MSSPTHRSAYSRGIKSLVWTVCALRKGLSLLGKCVRVLKKSQGSSKTGIEQEFLFNTNRQCTNIEHTKEMFCLCSGDITYKMSLGQRGIGVSACGSNQRNVWIRLKVTVNHMLLMLKVHHLGLAYSMEALTNVFVRVPMISKKKKGTFHGVEQYWEKKN